MPGNSLARQPESVNSQPAHTLIEDASRRNRRGFLAQNVAALRRSARLSNRRLSLNLLNLDTSAKLSKRRKRLKASLDDDLLSLLGIQLFH
jgi:hypothetical protein